MSSMPSVRVALLAIGILLLILSGVPAGHRECVYDSEQETTYSTSRATLFLSGLSLLVVGVFYTSLVQIFSPSLSLDW
jgi:uncharacterized membrane protein YiaA